MRREEPTKRRFSRRDAIGLLCAWVAAALLAVALPAWWLDAVLLDTRAWVDTVAPLADDPEVKAAIAEAASDAVIGRIDIRKRLDPLLPDFLERYAAILAAAAREAVRSEAAAIVRSDEFEPLWRDLNREGHAALVRAMTGQDTTGPVEPGTFAIETGPIVSRLAGELRRRDLGIIARIPPDTGSGRVVLFRSRMLARLGSYVPSVRLVADFGPHFSVALALLALAVARRRRRILLWLGAGGVMAAVLPLQAVYLGQFAAVSQLQRRVGLSTVASRTILERIFSELVTAEQVLAAAALGVWALAFLVGRPWNRFLRRVQGGARCSGDVRCMEERTATVDDVRTVGIVGAGLTLLALPPPRSMSQLVIVAMLLIVWLVYAETSGSVSFRDQDA